MTRPIKSALHNAPGRPIAAVVGLDPAYTGNAGIAVLVRPACAAGATPVLHAYRSCKLLDVATQRWLGDTIGAVCRPGERVVLVTESDAFGSLSVARKLGIGVGIVLGLLLDLNAVDTEELQEVKTQEWRKVVAYPVKRRTVRIVKGDGRDGAKAKAIAYAQHRFGLALPVDAAEAACIAEHWSQANPTWGCHIRPCTPTPTGLKKREG